MWERENDPARLGSRAVEGNNQMENVSNQAQLSYSKISREFLASVT